MFSRCARACAGDITLNTIQIASHSPWISTHCDLTGRPCQPSIDWWTKSNSACSFWKDFLSSQHYACYMPPWRPHHAFILCRDGLHAKFTNHSHPFRAGHMKKSWQIVLQRLGLNYLLGENHSFDFQLLFSESSNVFSVDSVDARNSQHLGIPKIQISSFVLCLCIADYPRKHHCFNAMSIQMILHNCKCCTHLSKGEALRILTMYYPVKVEHPWSFSLRLTGSLIPRCHLSQPGNHDVLWVGQMPWNNVEKKKYGKSTERAVELRNGNNFQYLL